MTQVSSAPVNSGSPRQQIKGSEGSLTNHVISTRLGEEFTSQGVSRCSHKQNLSFSVFEQDSYCLLSGGLTLSTNLVFVILVVLTLTDNDILNNSVCLSIENSIQRNVLGNSSRNYCHQKYWHNRLIFFFCNDNPKIPNFEKTLLVYNGQPLGQSHTVSITIDPLTRSRFPH